MERPPADTPRRGNRLARERSAYLRQHADNPVDWYPWGEAALARARELDRPLLVSIGYSACHWCHVMERESFADPETAALMNRLFVSVKVDREERPDVDQIYMDAVVRLTGQGGWPLTVFCLPDGRPFYGGTYFPPEPRHGMPSFRDVLRAVDEAWRERRGQVEEAAERLEAALVAVPPPASELPCGREALRRAARAVLARADPIHGGSRGAPKFPTVPHLELLLQAEEVLPPEEGQAALDHVLRTCRAICRGGLRDHLGGGFHRYCVDEDWGVPHFEKMLYDQGQLLSILARAWNRGGGADRDLEAAIRETAAYLDRELARPGGGFAASQDADSEGEEGRYYVFTPEEVASVLPPAEAERFCAAYGIRPGGDLEGGGCVLRRRPGVDPEGFREARAALFRARDRRVPPAIDPKVVLGWNALAVSGLARAGSLLGAPGLVARATRLARFLLGMRDGRGRLLRVRDEGGARIPAFLDDHAALLAALLDLARADAPEPWLPAAVEVAEALLEHFGDPATGDLYLAPADAEALPRRPRSEQGGATPDAAGLAAMGLIRVAALSGREDLRDAARRLLRARALDAERAGEAFAELARAAWLEEREVATAVVAGDPADPRALRLAEAARRALAPEDAVVIAAPGSVPAGLDPSLVAGRGLRGGRPAAYLCRGRVCSAPLGEPEEIARAAAPPAPGGGAPPS